MSDVILVEPLLSLRTGSKRLCCRATCGKLEQQAAAGDAKPPSHHTKPYIYSNTRFCRAMSGVLEQQAAAGDAKPPSRRTAKAKADANRAVTAAEADWDPSPGLALESLGAAADLLPLATAFQLLVTPSLSHGVGLRMKRESVGFRQASSFS
jgi:hypothetical protein